MKLQDARRQNNVTKLFEMFEKHQHKEQFPKGMDQKQEINRFSEESQKFLEDMNQTEIFENCARIQQNFNGLTAILSYGNRYHFWQLREKIEVQAEALQQPRRRTTTIFQSLALS